MLFVAARFQRIVFAMLPLFASTPCFSQDVISVFALGGQTCADFVADLQGVPIGQCLIWPQDKTYSTSCIYFQFAYGYIAKNNVDASKRGSQQAYISSEKSLDLSLRNYCNAHPLQGFSFAVENLIVGSVSPTSAGSVK